MPKRKPSTYNKILKEFTKLNNKLPEERKLSIKERRKIIKERILPQYQDVPAYKLRIKKIRNSILTEYDRIPPKEICDLNYIDPSEFAYVEWHSLDETIRELVPDCIYVKVTAGEFGETRIFNTRNYEYGRNGVRSIVEEIRPVANEEPSGTYIFVGIQKLRPRKKNDGTPENYYLDFVLHYIDNMGKEDPFGDTDSTRFDVPKGRKTRDKKAKVRKAIELKIKDLKSKKSSRKRAKKTLDKNLKDLSKKTKRIDKSKKPSVASVIQKDKQFEKISKLLEKYKKEGKLTQAEYDKALDKLFREMGIKK